MHRVPRKPPTTEPPVTDMLGAEHKESPDVSDYIDLQSRPAPQRAPMVTRKQNKQPARRQNLARNKQARKRGRVIRSPLKDVSASSISLQDAADFAGAAWKYGAYAIAAFNVEEKESYQLLQNGTITGTNFFRPLQLAQGLDYNQREGDSVKVGNLRMDIVLQANVTAVQNFTRVIVLRDFMNQGATPAAAAVFQDTSSNAAVIVSPYLHSLGDRFEVLSDIVVCQTIATDTNLIHKRLAYGINDHVLYQGTSAAIGDTWAGEIYIIIATDQVTNGPKLIMSALTTYVDN